MSVPRNGRLFDRVEEKGPTPAGSPGQGRSAAPRLPSVAGGSAGVAVPPTRTVNDLPGLGRRSFAAPDGRPGRIGVVDAGSNSVRLVIFEGAARSADVVFNEKVMCGLGGDLSRTGRLAPEGRARALAAIARFAAVAEHLQVATLAGVATAAIREAADGPAFQHEVEAATGVRLEIASGADEARLAAEGVLYGNPGAEGVVVDLGGASMELCAVGNGRPGAGVTMPLGPQRLRGQTVPAGMIEATLRDALPVLCPDRKPVPRLYLVGGSWRALARVDLERRGYPLKVLHEYTLTASEAHALARYAMRATPEEMAVLDGVSENRAPSLPLAAQILKGLLSMLQPEAVAVSAFGLREGVCYTSMPPDLRRRDPLLAAAEDMERKGARAFGFGQELASWLAAAFAPLSASDLRLLKAACHLADVNWRTHPDHRHQACWEAATRVSLTDLGHAGRVCLATAVSARYRNGKAPSAETGLGVLAGAPALEQARAIGLGMRLGCTLAAATPGILTHCGLRGDGDRLVMRLSGPAREMAGEDVNKRLGQFARALGYSAHAFEIG
ncbi:MAG: Ppx/GppA family phosphatase [Pseudomonadota bacterium]